MINGKYVSASKQGVVQNSSESATMTTSLFEALFYKFFLTDIDLAALLTMEVNIPVSVSMQSGDKETDWQL